MKVREAGGHPCVSGKAGWLARVAVLLEVCFVLSELFFFSSPRLHHTACGILVPQPGTEPGLRWNR